MSQITAGGTGRPAQHLIVKLMPIKRDPPPEIKYELMKKRRRQHGISFERRA